MFRENYKKELDNLTVSDNFKDDTITIMEGHVNSTVRTNNKIHFKRNLISFVAIFALCAVTAYSTGILNVGKNGAPLELASRTDERSAQIVNFEETVQDSEEDFCHFCDMVVVDGTTYWRTNKTDNNARCGMMDGYITSTVENGRLATQDDQSNFGTGYGYQYGQESDTIEVNIDGEWIVFSIILEEDE